MTTTVYSKIEQFIDQHDYALSLVPAVAFLVLMGKLVYMFVSLCWLCIGHLFGAARQSSEKRSFRARFLSKANLSQLMGLAMIATEPHYADRDMDGLFMLIQGTDPRLQEILQRVPAIQQGPQPPWLLRNRHVQFFPWLIQNEIHRQQGIPFQRIHVPVTDCLDKMSILDGTCHWSYTDAHANEQNGTLHQPTMKDTITLDVFPPFQEDDTCTSWDPKTNQGSQFNRSSPVIFFSPGLRCHSQDMPGNMIIRKAYERGFRSIVVHRRGHTPNQRLQSPRWNLFGDVDDLEQVYWHVRNELVSPHTALFLHGISSGTAVTVTALSKWDRQRHEEPQLGPRPTFVASISVTPGYDISTVFSRDRFMNPYHDLLLPGVKDHFVRQNEALLRAHNSTAVDRALAATSLQEFIEASVPFAGYSNVTDYYTDTNPVNDFRDISTPKLVLNARDDPCCNIHNLFDVSPRPTHEGKTYAEIIEETEHGLVAITHTGSHIPFLCTRQKWLPFTRDPLTGGWMLHSWGDQVAIDYYSAALEVYGDRRFL